MKLGTPALLLLSLLAGCAQTVSNDLVKLTLPDVVNYDKDTLKRAANELERHCPIVPTLCLMVTDYGIMRDQTRVARGETVDISR